MFHFVLSPQCVRSTTCSTVSMFHPLFHCIVSPPCLCSILCSTVSKVHRIYFPPHIPLYLKSTLSVTPYVPLWLKSTVSMFHHMFHFVFILPCLCSTTGGLISSHWEMLIKPQVWYTTSPLCHYYPSIRVTKLVLGLGLGF